MFAADGSNIDVIGKAEFLVILGNKQNILKFVVAKKIVYNCILGMDFLLKFGFKFEISNDKFTFKQNENNGIFKNLCLKDKNSNCLNVVYHKIDTSTSKPIKNFCRRIPFHCRKLINELISEMLEKDVIEKSSSDWAFNAVIVPKKSGKYRLFVDYKKLNAITIKDAYPVPRMDDILDLLGNS